MNPQPLQLGYTPPGDRCIYCNADAYECEHYEQEKTGEDWEIYWDERRAR